MKRIKFSDNVKKKVKKVKFKSGFITLMNIFYIFILAICSMFAFAIHNVTGLPFNNKVFFILYFFGASALLLIWSFKKTVLPKNLDNILEDSFALHKISEKSFEKIGVPYLKFSYNISHHVPLGRRRYYDLNPHTYTISSQMRINKNNLTISKESLEISNELRKQYDFLSFDIIENNNEIIITIKHIFTCSNIASSNFIMCIVFSMYEVYEKIINNMNFNA